MSDMCILFGKVFGFGFVKDGIDYFWKQCLIVVVNVFLIFFFVILVIVMQGLSYGDVVEILKNLLVFIILLLVIFFGVYYMKFGMQVIIEDYIYGEGLKFLMVMVNMFFCVFIGFGCIFVVFKIGFGG